MNDNIWLSLVDALADQIGIADISPSIHREATAQTRALKQAIGIRIQRESEYLMSALAEHHTEPRPLEARMPGYEELHLGSLSISWLPQPELFTPLQASGCTLLTVYVHARRKLGQDGPP